MIRILGCVTVSVSIAMSVSAVSAQERHNTSNANGRFDALIARHASANHVPEALVRRIIHRESGGNPRAVSKGNYGLMQIRLGTARALGYRGSAAGLLDANTNLTYAVKYLAGAYHVAGGNPDRAVHYYAAGYYYAAKRKGLIDPQASRPTGALASAPAPKTAARAAKAGPRALKSRVAQARANGDSNVASSSDMYTGRTDYF
jgi:soluble lytic murein transglycosylase-like protein